MRRALAITWAAVVWVALRQLQHEHRLGADLEGYLTQRDGELRDAFAGIHRWQTELVGELARALKGERR